MSVIRRTTHALLTLMLSTAVLPAQSVDAILAKHNKAVDPEGRIGSLQGMKMTATMEMPANGMSATVVGISRAPNQNAVTITIPGLGEMRQGYDGAMAWASDPMQGPRIITGPEAAASIDGSGPQSIIRTADKFSASEVVGEAELDGEKCVRVKHTWKSQRVTTDCYSLATGHVIETLATQVSQQGEMQTTSRFSDFRNVGGFVTAHKIVVSVMGMQQIVTTTSIEYGAQPAEAVEPPPAVKALKKP